jgi:peptide deformylase
MAVLKIYKYPHPVLRVPGAPVDTFDDALRQVVSDMVETMYDCAGAVGLAAPQVGLSQRIFVMDVAAKSAKDQLRIIINPEITQQSKNKLVREGCLSLPDYLANVKRAQKITLTYQNEWGEAQEHQAEYFEAVAIQHEIDHLDGVLMIDRIQSLKTDLIRRL